jgi:hypothetical protein
MASWKWTKRVLASLAVLAAAMLFSLTDAEAHGRGAPRGGHGPVVVGGFYGRPAFGYGFGFGGFGYAPYWGMYGWGPYPYPPGGGIDLSAALIAGYGAVEFDTKPGQAEVWIDGKYVAEARDLDGYPSYLWLSEGPHKVTVYKGGFERFEEEIDVRRGVHRELKVRLAKGESQPPGQRPDKKEKKEEKEKEKTDFSF